MKKSNQEQIPNTISLEEFVKNYFPPYEDTPYQKDEYFNKVIDKDHMLELFKKKSIIFMRINGRFILHRISPMVVTFNSGNGKISSKRSQENKSYDDYKQYLVSKFKEGIVYVKKTRDDSE